MYLDLTIGEIRLDVRGYLVHVRGRPVPLSPRELCLLETLMRQAGRVQSFRSLYEDVWGQPNSDDFRSLKTQLEMLIERMGSAGRPGA